MIYYSVDRHGTCAEGKECQLEPYEDRTEPLQGIGEHIRAMCPEGYSVHGKRYYSHGGRNEPSCGSYRQDYTCSPYYKDALLELLAELVRQAHYRDKPSRFQSMFAWDSLANAKTWQSNHAPGSPIYELIPTQRVHRGDMALLTLGGTMARINMQLHLYWQGNTLVSSDHSPTWEYLLEHPVRVGVLVECSPYWHNTRMMERYFNPDR